MANSPVDKSKEFIESGMTLITDHASDRYLDQKTKKERQEELKRVHQTIRLNCEDL